MDNETPLREKRKQQNLTVADMARLTGHEYNRLIRYEKGYAWPSRQTAEDLAEILDCQVDDIFPHRFNDSVTYHA